MTTRRLALIALIFAVLMQTGMVMAYHHLTGGCFCQATRAPSPPAPPPLVFDFIMLATLPIREIPPAMGLHLLGQWSEGSLVRAWISMFVFAAINTVVWFAGTFALVWGIVMPFAQASIERNGNSARA